MIQSWLFSGVSLSPVKFNQLSALKEPLEDQVQSGLENGNNSSLIATTEDDNATIVNHDILSRLRRSPNPCESERVLTWSHCLGRYFFKLYCNEKTPVGCILETGRVPPKCKKNHVVRFGKSGRPCRVLQSCTCA